MFRSHAKVAAEVRRRDRFDDDLESQVVQRGLAVLDEVELEEWLRREDEWFVAMLQDEAYGYIAGVGRIERSSGEVW
jgi:hypothetical protein